MVKDRKILSLSQEQLRFGRVLLVGAAGTLLDFTLLMLLKGFGVPILLANSVAFSAGVGNNFALNRCWTFADRKREDWHRQLAAYLLVSLAGLAMNNIILLLLGGVFGKLIGEQGLGYLPAKCVATGVVVFWNYIANRNWTFGREDEDRQRGERAQAGA